MVTEGCWSKQKKEGKGEINDQAVGDHERGGNSRRREGEGKKEEKCPGGKKEEEETKKKSGEPAGRNELEVNQTYRSYRSRYHYHLPNYYLQQVYIWTLPRLPYPMHRIVCQNSEITYVLYLSRGYVGVPYSSRCSFSRNSIPFGIEASPLRSSFLSYRTIKF